MPHVTRFAIAIVIGVCTTPQLRADGLIRSLPEDGRWVEFHGTLKFAGNESSGKVLLRSVGTEDVNGKPARWVELESQVDGMTHELVKMLVPESKLKAGFDPVDHYVRAWRRTGEEAPRLVENPKELDYSVLGAMLHAPMEKSETGTTEREFPWQKGKLTATPISGKRKLDEDANIRGTIESTVWPHADVPFGVAGLTVDVEPENASTSIVLELVVSDFGKDAKSAMPDKK